MQTILPKIADSLYFKQQLDTLLVDNVNPIEQPNLFRLLSVRLQRNLLASLATNVSSLVIKFNENVKWISSRVWTLYFMLYYQQQVNHGIEENVKRQKLRNPLPPLNVSMDYLDPNKCNLSTQNWSKNGIRDIHQGFICVISEYLHNTDIDGITFNDTDRVLWIELIFKAMSDRFKLKLDKQQQNVVKSKYYDNEQHSQLQSELTQPQSPSKLKQIMIDNVRQKLIHGHLQIRARIFGSINISRNSSVDCSIRAKDFIWAWKRLGQDPMAKYNVAGRIKCIFQIDNLDAVIPHLPNMFFPYNIFVLMELWKPCNKNNWIDNIKTEDIG